MLIELMCPPPGEGQPVQKITALSDQIVFVFKQPLQPVFQVAMGATMLPCLGDYDAVLTQVEKAGLNIFDTPEGAQAAINKNHIAFFTSPSLGLYSFMFTNKVGMTVKATTAEITGLFEKKSRIIS